MDRNKISAATEFFTKNEYWKKKYDEAPSEACREKIALEFYFSTFWDEAHEDPEFFRLDAETESRLDLGDWKYLLQYQGNNPGVIKIKQKIRELEEAGAGNPEKSVVKKVQDTV